MEAIVCKEEEKKVKGKKFFFELTIYGDLIPGD